MGLSRARRGAVAGWAAVLLATVAGAGCSAERQLAWDRYWDRRGSEWNSFWTARQMEWTDFWRSDQVARVGEGLLVTAVVVGEVFAFVALGGCGGAYHGGWSDGGRFWHWSSDGCGRSGWGGDGLTVRFGR
jgi:hypothetical protein